MVLSSSRRKRRGVGSQLYVGVHCMFFEGRAAGLEGGARDQEYFLAHACLVLGFACILTTYLDPAVLGRHVTLGRLSIFAYFAYGLLNLTVVLFGRHAGLVWRLGSHFADVILASLIITFTGGTYSPFLILYFFVLLRRPAVGAWQGPSRRSASASFFCCSRQLPLLHGPMACCTGSGAVISMRSSPYWSCRHISLAC